MENVVLVFFFLISNSFSANQKPLQVNLRKKTPKLIHCHIHFLYHFDHSEIIESWKTSFFYWIMILSCLLHNNFFFVKKKEFTKGSWHETFWSKSFFSLLLRAHTKKREVCCWWEWIIRGDRIVGKQSIPLFVSRVRRYWCSQTV